MKIKSILLLGCFLFLGTAGTHAQFFKKLKDRAKEAAEEAVVRKTEEKTIEKTEQAIDTLLNQTKKIGKKKKRKREKDEVEEGYEGSNEEYPGETYEGDNSNGQQPQLWSQYNFVPGDQIIFYDDLAGEENGEFPSRWDIIKGNAENASFDGENVIGLKHGSIIMPLMDTHDYLPEVFTLEFDIYFDIKKYSYRSKYLLRFGPEENSHRFGENNKDWITPIDITKNDIKFSTDVNGVRKNFSNPKTELEELGQGAWRHIAIAFNKRSLKIFIDEHRLVNLPNLGFKPEMFSIGYWNNYAGDDEVIAVKNIRLAEGGKKLYDRVVAEGKFVTRGILFDVNSATIKAESGGVLKEVARMMQDHPNLNFRIEGHTDSDGADDHNLTLSAERAEAVKWALVERGIDENRFETEGKGETTPVDSNATPEGRANNRRVEFVKL